MISSKKLLSITGREENTMKFLAILAMSHSKSCRLRGNLDTRQCGIPAIISTITSSPEEPRKIFWEQSMALPTKKMENFMSLNSSQKNSSSRPWIDAAVIKWDLKSSWLLTTIKMLLQYSIHSRITSQSWQPSRSSQHAFLLLPGLI